MNRIAFATQSTMATAALAAGVVTAAGTAYITPMEPSGSAPTPLRYAEITPIRSATTPVAMAGLATPNSLVVPAKPLPVDIGSVAPTADTDSGGVGGGVAGVSSSMFFAPNIIAHIAPTTGGGAPTTLDVHPLL